MREKWSNRLDNRQCSAHIYSMEARPCTSCLPPLLPHFRCTMSAYSDTSGYDHADAREALPLDLLKDAAELRAAGRDWIEVGAALGRNPTHLRLACRRDPRFAAELEEARREVLREIEAEVLRKMREHMLGEDTELAGARAAERLAKYLTACRNCETRLQVEEVKKETKLGAEQIKADAKAPKRESDAEERDPGLPPSADGRRPSPDERATCASAPLAGETRTERDDSRLAECRGAGVPASAGAEQLTG